MCLSLLTTPFGCILQDMNAFAQNTYTLSSQNVTTECCETSKKATAAGSAPVLVDKAGFLEHESPHIFVEFLNVEQPYPMHEHSFVELAVVLDGLATHRIEDNEFPSFPGDTCVFRGHRRHCFTQQENLHVANVQFLWSALEPVIDDLRLEPGFRALFELEPRVRHAHGFRSRLALRPSQLAFVRELIEELKRELDAKRPGYKFIARSLFHTLCGYLGRAYGESNSQNQVHLNNVSLVLNLMEQQYHRPITTGPAHINHEGGRLARASSELKRSRSK